MTDASTLVAEVGSAEDNIQAVADEKIRQLEEKYDLLRYQVDGWRVWTVLRFWVASQTIDIGLKHETTRSTLFDRLLIAVGSIPGFLFPRQAEYLVKTYTSARGETQGPLYKDFYFDDLLVRLRSFMKIEAVNNLGMWDRSKAAWIRSYLYTPLIELATFGIKNIFATTRKFSGIDRDLREILAREFGLVLPAGQIAKMVADFYWSKRIYGWLLDHIRPRAVLVADPGEFPILAAAKERGIKTFELSHAVCDRYHWSYSWSEYARPYKEFMPVADKLLLYGDYMKDEFGIRDFWGNALCAVGSLRVDEYRNRKAAKLSSTGCILTVTTQGIQRDEFIAFLSEFLERAVRDDFSMMMLVKLHPVYDRDPQPYRSAFEKFGARVRVISANEAPSTFESISRSHLHASVSSSCHYEALGLGVPTIILPFATHESVLHLAKAGHAYFAGSPQEMFSITRNWKTLAVAERTSRYYFKPNALENLLEVLAP